MKKLHIVIACIVVALFTLSVTTKSASYLNRNLNYGNSFKGAASNEAGQYVYR
ncbi:hypothetical protein [Liquorilactobacillus aquaticus]|uniref:hypothetical protein n=1 Tax=Liquorilactobacillus aquaticus TaxID=392566 RepID=UPI000A61AD37|nr:hypothetical protein [Liquorilactobacillus aquaticus]